jgi:hypothetical protein
MTSMQTKLRRKQGRPKTGPPFVQLFKYMLRSPAWLSLSTVARAAYVQLALRYDGVNNGMIALSVRVLAEELGCGKDTASRALIELEDAGFIETLKIGSFSSRMASEYRLTTFRCDATGELPTKKFTVPGVSTPKKKPPKPWDVEGISRRTWYRRKNGTDGTPHGPCHQDQMVRFDCATVPKGPPQSDHRDQNLCHGTPDGPHQKDTYRISPGRFSADSVGDECHGDGVPWEEVR